MFEGLLMLLSLSVVMAIASFLAGMLPLSLTLSQSQLRLLTTLGMGVLVGTSLIVIIPEGIETLYSASNEAVAHKRRSLVTTLDVRMPSFNAPVMWTRDSTDVFNVPGPVIPSSIANAEAKSQAPPKTPTKEGEVGILASSNQGADKTDEHDHEHSSSPHAWVGIALVSGFILMYLIDTLPQLAPAPASTRSNVISLSSLSSGSSPSDATQPAKGSLSTTLGLLIHAFADGIALGASSTMPGLSFIVFFAIMIHKAPAAFGLTTVLLRQGLSKRQARMHLAAFSLAAPAGAIVTWLVAGLLGGISGASMDGAGMKWWTGLILLFSGGTFLFVAMHTMQEVDSLAEETDGQNMNGYLSVDDRGGHRHGPKKSLPLVGAAVVGMIIPAITQIGHAH